MPALVPPGAPPTPTTPNCPWSKRRRWIFRTGACLFAVELAHSLLDVGPRTRALAASLAAAIHDAATAVAPRLVDGVTALAGRGDGHRVLLNLLGDLLLACALGAVWSALDRRPHHERLAGAMRVTLRYLVAVVILIYGGLKVVPVQFPAPSAEALLRPTGQHSPMSLLWLFMGVSPAYTVFGGLGEVLGGTLLLWRRTTTLGALVLVGVLANVAMLNFAYDVPVKHAASLLLLAAMVLAARDVPRLARVLWSDLPTERGGEPAFCGPRWAQRLRAVLKPAIVTAAVAGPMVVALCLSPARAPDSPLRGVYAVVKFVAAGREVPPSLTEPTRWRRVALGDRGDAVVQSMADTFARHALAVDEAHATVSLTRRETMECLVFRCERTASGDLHWIADGGGGGVDEVVLRPVDEGVVFRVLK